MCVYKEEGGEGLHKDSPVVRVVQLRNQTRQEQNNSKINKDLNTCLNISVHKLQHPNIQGNLYTDLNKRHLGQIKGQPASQTAYLFCSSSLASSSTSSGLSCAGEDGERAGEDRDVEEEAAVVCRDVGVATWLAI